jgi:hypothetical protein
MRSLSTGANPRARNPLAVAEDSTGSPSPMSRARIAASWKGSCVRCIAGPLGKAFIPKVAYESDLSHTSIQGRSIFFVKNFRNTFVAQIHASWPTGQDERHLDPLFFNGSLFLGAVLIRNSNGSPFGQLGATFQNHYAISNATWNFHLGIVPGSICQSKPTKNLNPPAPHSLRWQPIGFSSPLAHSQCTLTFRLIQERQGTVAPRRRSISLRIRCAGPRGRSIMRASTKLSTGSCSLSRIKAWQNRSYVHELFSIPESFGNRFSTI